MTITDYDLADDRHTDEWADAHDALHLELYGDLEDADCNLCGGSGGGDFPMTCPGCGGSGGYPYPRRF